jgi:hypothetical protein
MKVRSTLFIASISLAVFGAGCIAGPYREATPGELALSASWQDSTHLDVGVKNVGGSPMPLGGTDGMRLTGPDGTMPLHWNGMAPTLAPGESRQFDLHAMHMVDGTMGMTMDHAMAGEHMPMPSGDYLLSIGGATSLATLRS